MRGMTRSVRTTVGRKLVSLSSASIPSPATSLSKPQLSTSSDNPARAEASSSTMRTRPEAREAAASVALPRTAVVAWGSITVSYRV